MSTATSPPPDGEFSLSSLHVHVSSLVFVTALAVVVWTVARWSRAESSSSKRTAKSSSASASSSSSGGANRTSFQSFQRMYLLIHLTMMAADWMQGPYVYALYEHYGFSQVQIGRLFIAGFGSSMVFGTVAGSAADRHGRKLLCLVFGAVYSLSCLTKHVGDFNVLLVGRVTGGIATSILFSAFESWMVTEHQRQHFTEQQLGDTFSRFVSGNGIIAIVSSLVASMARDWWGVVAPFDVSLLLLIGGTILVATQWRENYGDASVSTQRSMADAIEAVRSDPKVFLLAVTQASFEGGMYTFVFMWTPALGGAEGAPEEMLHGWVFASFMLCVFIGSNLFSIATGPALQWNVRSFPWAVYLVAGLALHVPVLSTDHSHRLTAFFVFEVCCGLFWTSQGTLRGQYIPPNVRASTMNMFRVPLNGIVVLVLYNIDNISEATVFKIASGCVVVSAVSQYLFSREVALEVMDKGDDRDGHAQELDDLAAGRHRVAAEE